MFVYVYDNNLLYWIYICVCMCTCIIYVCTISLITSFVTSNALTLMLMMVIASVRSYYYLVLTVTLLLHERMYVWNFVSMFGLVFVYFLCYSGLLTHCVCILMQYVFLKILWKIFIFVTLLFCYFVHNFQFSAGNYIWCVVFNDDRVILMMKKP